MFVSDETYKLSDESQETILAVLNQVLNDNGPNSKCVFQIREENFESDTHICKEIFRENWEGNEKTELIIFTTEKLP